MTTEDIERWLRETDETRLASLWQRADAVRRATVGDAVHLRGLLEISSHCVRSCAYCGLRAPNAAPRRYRMTADEVLAGAREAASYGYGTVVLQAGEDHGLSRDWVADVVRAIKRETPLAVTLSLGERSDTELAAWREAGADRYLLRFETSDRELYDHIHPPLAGRESDRFAILRTLGELGYEVGSGVMIGIPGQSYGSLARDIALFRALDLDMVGVGPYIPHGDTPLATEDRACLAAAAPPIDQVPRSENMVYKVLALTRLLCPEANIPSTTALATLNKASGRELGLMRGANVVMPNVTPRRYRALYSIYPAKACLDETAEECRTCMRGRIHSIGRTVGTGPGSRTRTHVTPLGTTFAPDR